MRKKIVPFTPPNPIEDPKQLIESVERFYRLVKVGISSGGWAQGMDYMRSDLSAIRDPRVKAGALELFQRVLGGHYVLSRDPELKDPVVLPSIQKLIDYLKAELK